MCFSLFVIANKIPLIKYRLILEWLNLMRLDIGLI